jgi:hypothetical protein
MGNIKHANMNNMSISPGTLMAVVMMKVAVVMMMMMMMVSINNSTDSNSNNNNNMFISIVGGDDGGGGGTCRRRLSSTWMQWQPCSLTCGSPCVMRSQQQAHAASECRQHSSAQAR